MTIPRGGRMTRWVALALLAAMIPTGSSAFQARESLARGGSYFDQCVARSEEHTSELQSLMRISYAVFCLKNNNNESTHTNYTQRDTEHSSHSTYNISQSLY